MTGQVVSRPSLPVAILTDRPRQGLWGQVPRSPSDRDDGLRKYMRTDVNEEVVSS